MHSNIPVESKVFDALRSTCREMRDDRCFGDRPTIFLHTRSLALRGDASVGFARLSVHMIRTCGQLCRYAHVAGSFALYYYMMQTHAPGAVPDWKPGSIDVFVSQPHRADSARMILTRAGICSDWICYEETRARGHRAGQGRVSLLFEGGARSHDGRLRPKARIFKMDAGMDLRSLLSSFDMHQVAVAMRVHARTHSVDFVASEHTESCIRSMTLSLSPSSYDRPWTGTLGAVRHQRRRIQLYEERGFRRVDA